MEIEKHGNVSIDLGALGGRIVHLRVPFHQSTRLLIDEIAEIYGLQAVQEREQFQSFKALTTEQFIQGSQSLLDANIKDGEILVVTK